MTWFPFDWTATLAGFGIGLIVGVTGVGGGSLMTPLLISVFNLEKAVAIGTDLWFAALTKTGGATRVTDAPSRDASGDQGFIQYASGRRLERIRQQEAVVDLILRGSQDIGSPFGDSNSSGIGAGQRLASSMFSAEMTVPGG